MKHLLFLLTLLFFIISCKKDSNTINIDYKIKILTIIYGNDTAIYYFNYNEADLLNEVSKNNALYANISYSNQQAILIRHFPFADTFKINYTGNNYINTIEKNNFRKSFYRNSTNELDSIRTIEAYISLYHNNIIYDNNNITNYKQNLPYTCGFYDLCTSESLDTIIYSNKKLQYNLPEQFIGIPISEGFSLLELNTIYLMQLSNILPYKATNNLRLLWSTHYSIFVSQSPPTKFQLAYKYQYDSLDRVTNIDVYRTNNGLESNFRSYVISY